MSLGDNFLDNGRSPVKVRTAPLVMKRPLPDVDRVEAFARRIAGLQPGRYEIVLSVTADGLEDWTVIHKGKIER